MITKITKIIIANLIIIYFTVIAAYSQTAGSLDNTFGNSGIDTTSLDGMINYNIANALVLQADGKIVVVGSSFNGYRSHFAIARYNISGVLDNTFGTGGKLITSVGSSTSISAAYSVALQNDGKIVVAGYSDTTSWKKFAVVRYDTNGSLDNTFGTGGKIITSFGNYSDMDYAVEIQTDGKIIVAGTSGDTTSSHFAIARYNTNGALDTTYGTGGKVIDDTANATAMALQADGKIIITGYSSITSPCFIVTKRYNTDGTPDAAFGINGKVTTIIGNDAHANAIKIQADGKIIIAGYITNGSIENFAAIRYNANGTVDNSFGTSGIINIHVGYTYGSAAAAGIVIQTDGKIVLAGGSAINDSVTVITVVRYDTGGTSDNSFGIGGFVTTDIGNYYSTANSIALQTDGKIVVAGISVYGNGSHRSFALARYNCGSLGIDEITNNNYINLYPNPVTDNLQIQTALQIKDIEITDITGRLLYTTNAKIINCSSFAKGVYFIKATTEKGVVVKKFIKE